MPDKEAKLKILISKKNTYFTRIQRLYDDSFNVTDPVICKNFKIRYKTLDETRKLFNDILDDITAIKLELDEDYIPNFQELDVVDELFCNIQAVAQRIVTVEGAAEKIKPKLPNIDLVGFSGLMLEWPIFYETFKTLVHDRKDIDDISKLHYLLSKLSGRALAVVAGIQPTGSNYKIFWDVLVQKYQDVRLLANSYFSQILEFKPAQTESAGSLNAFLEKFVTSVTALKELKLLDLTDFILSFLALSKLDNQTHRLFEQSGLSSTNIPKYEDVVNFVKEQAKVLTCVNKSSSNFVKNSSFKAKSSHTVLVNTVGKSNQSEAPCVVCKDSVHPIYKCAKFLEMNSFDRFKLAKNLFLCLNCLGSMHKISSCPSLNKCSHCQMKHHSLLHFSKPNASNLTVANELANNSPSSSTCTSLYSRLENKRRLTQVSKPVTLLPTALVNVLSNSSTSSTVRVLVDSCSEAHFLTSSCCKRLKLTVEKVNWSAMGLGGHVNKIVGKVHLVIASRFDSNAIYDIEAFVVDKISDRLPSQSILSNQLDYFLQLPLADDKFYEPGSVDGILGSELFSTILLSKKLSISPLLPVALETTLGYIVSGKIDSFVKPQPVCFVSNIVENLEKFWELEEVPKPRSSLNQEDVCCEQIFKSTLTRDTSGRYTVALPFREKPPNFENSFPIALNRFLALEKRFRASPTFHENYCRVMQDYIDQGHLSLISEKELEAPGFFIPHHAIYKESSSTPIRIVFDASAKSQGSVSLNDSIYTGEKLQTNIVSILLKFRLFEIAMTSDVRQMYHQILIRPEDRSYQRILWRRSSNEPLQVYQGNVVMFGIKSSPYLALRIIKQLASDESENYPAASKVAFEGTYMDDVVCSVPTYSEAKELHQQLLGLFRAGGFALTKWSTNCSKLLEQVPENDRHPATVQFEDGLLKVLGFQWQPDVDMLSFNLNLSSRDCTKRNILSTVARIWDPLGLLSPVTLFAKLLIKELWISQVGWDEPVSSQIRDLWLNFQKELSLLTQFQVPRCFALYPNAPVELIGFTDASEKAYGAVVYLKVIQNGKPTISLVVAKSKVAPMKYNSIPRLELCAAVLLSNLIQFVVETLRSVVVINSVFALTDSTVVLHWINSSPHRWGPFVANRVSHIQELISPTDWFHVSGEQNSADCISRGLSPRVFMERDTWVSGPSWLLGSSESWPIGSYSVNHVHSYEEKTRSFVNIVEVNTHPLRNLIDKSSSWNKLRHVVVYLLRFCRRCPKVAQFSVEDLRIAETLLIRTIQKEHFPLELELLKQGKPSSTKLRHLSPFLDDGIIRVGGRLKNSDLKYDQKYPVLLPKSEKLVDLIISHFHVQNLHTGPHLLLSLIRQHFWIISGRSVVRRIVRNCNLCFRMHPRATFPMMADLPAVRVNATKPFLHSGVDYGGPFFITQRRGRGIKSHKAYLCLFVCLVTKAIHLELASDLSTSSFLNAFKRFISRRGQCSVLYSDCGTNFLGAKRELDSIFTLIQSKSYFETIQDELTKHRIEWKFNPPAAPHFGGIWEANIKSVKSHLRKIIGDQILTYEEFLTVLTQIEALLNSRPLVELSADPSDPAVLTPAHFLNQAPLSFLPALDYLNTTHTLITRKELLDKLVQSYWKRWHLEYLNTLQSRQKWNTPSKPVTVGTLVILYNEDSPPLRWPLGVIIKLYPGSDGIVRTVLVKTKAGTYKRPVVKLCPLPTQ